MIAIRTFSVKSATLWKKFNSAENTTWNLCTLWSFCIFCNWLFHDRCHISLSAFNHTDLTMESNLIGLVYYLIFFILLSQTTFGQPQSRWIKLYINIYGSFSNPEYAWKEQPSQNSWKERTRERQTLKHQHTEQGSRSMRYSLQDFVKL